MAENLTQITRSYKFRDVIGNKKIVSEFIQRSKDKNFPQVILIEGMTGIGKTTLARLVAMSANCKHLEDGEPCGECPSCKAIKAERFRDVSVMEQDARDIKVEQIDQIRDFISTPSMLDPFKIVFIDELQGFFGQGSSASARDKMLKILEKTYKNVIFILGTMDGDTIPKALRNRTVSYKLKPLTTEEIVGHLYNVAKDRSVKIGASEAEVLLAIAQYAEGSMRTAISYLERCIYGNIWTKEELISELSITPDQTIIDYTQMILTGNSSILDVYLSGGVIDSIQDTVVLILKKQMGAKLKQEELNKIGKLPTLHSKEKAMTLLNEILEAKKNGFITSAMITLMLVKLLDRFKTEDKPKVIARNAIKP